jgi:hypothetical protein
MSVLPQRPLSFPIVWNGYGRMSLPPRFALWFPERQDFQIVDVNRECYPAFILTNTRTDRGKPFYFANTEPDSSVRMIRVYKPRATRNSEIDVLMWFTGGWLCRKNQDRMQAIIPILGVSDTSKLPFASNLGTVPSECYENWKVHQNVPEYKQFVRDCLLRGTGQLGSPMKCGTEQPAAKPIPEFVCRALIREAIEKRESCPISLSEFTPETSMSVTSCYHVFETDSLTVWLNTNSSCPVCKQPCVHTHILSPHPLVASNNNDLNSETVIIE